MRLILAGDAQTESDLREPLTAAGFELDVVPSPEAAADACQAGPAPLALLARVETPAVGTQVSRDWRARLGAGAPPVVLIPPAQSPADIWRANGGVAGAWVVRGQGADVVRLLQQLVGKREDAPRAPPNGAPSSRPPAAAGLPPRTTAPVGPPPGMTPASMARDGRAATPAQAGPPIAAPAVPAPAAEPERDPSLDTTADGEQDFSALLERKANLAWLVDQERGPDKEEVPVPESPAPTRARFDPRAVDIWPFALLSIDAALAILKGRAKGAAPAGAEDEPALGDTWKTITNAEVHALWALAEAGPRKAASANEEELAGVTAIRLRTQAAIIQAELILAAGIRVDVDEDTVDELLHDIGQAASKSIDGNIQAAMAGNDPELLNEYRAIRESLLLKRRELDEAAIRLRGRGAPRTKAPPPAAAPAPSIRKRPSWLRLAVRDSGEWLAAHSGVILRVSAVLAILAGAAVYFLHRGPPGSSGPSGTSGTNLFGSEAAPGETGTSPDGKADAPVAQPIKAVPLTPREVECQRMAGGRRGLEPGSLRLDGTIAGPNGATALISEGHRSTQVRAGEFIGSHCWRIAHVGEDSVTFAMAPDPADPTGVEKTTRVYVRKH
jgi:hypothetical protein